MSGSGGWTVREIAASAGDGTVAVTELARTVSDAITRLDPGDGGLRAFLSHDPGLLSVEAGRIERRLERHRAEGRPSPSLAGVPVAVKDNLCVLGHATTCGSRLLEAFRPPYEATVVRRLRQHGALIAGKTNMDEFAMGSSTENSAFGPTRNPADRGRVPGGSSGGSAAAVAAGMVPVALGSDTGGSVRQPAALCGIVGIKPTYGAVSRYGLVAFASSLDQVGVLGRTVADAAALLEVIVGPDPRDSTSSPHALSDLQEQLEWGMNGLVVGVPDEYFPDDLDPGIRRATSDALEYLARQGADVRRISLPHTGLALPAYYVLAPAEASTNLARYDGVRFGRRIGGRDWVDLYTQTRSTGFGPEVKRRILLGTYALCAGYHERYYGSAQRVRRLVAADITTAFAGGVDVIFTPTTPDVAFPLGERTRDPYRMYLADSFTVAANLAGIPAASVPIGTSEGLPVGGQLMAPAWQEQRLVRAAAALERAGGDPPAGRVQ